VSVLSARDAYRLWAPTYEAETVVSFLEDRLVAAIGTPTTARSLLDVGCGTARRLDATDARSVVGVDLSTEMLVSSTGEHTLVAGDVRALPFAAGSFDVVWCRLVIGHVQELGHAYAELSRVCRDGGDVIVTDFHPDAVAAGHRRTFRDTVGLSHEIEHYVHDATAHDTAARAARLTPTKRSDAFVGPAVRHFYVAADRLDAYEMQTGLRLVLALAFRKPT
jgi:malonyl-CoA O-methyltransferase